MYYMGTILEAYTATVFNIFYRESIFTNIIVLYNMLNNVMHNYSSASAHSTHIDDDWPCWPVRFSQAIAPIGLDKMIAFKCKLFGY